MEKKHWILGSIGRPDKIFSYRIDCPEASLSCKCKHCQRILVSPCSLDSRIIHCILFEQCIKSASRTIGDREVGGARKIWSIINELQLARIQSVDSKLNIEVDHQIDFSSNSRVNDENRKLLSGYRVDTT